MWNEIRRRGKPPSPDAEAPRYDPETDRRNASEILEQARWLYDQHERRSNSAQKQAGTVLAFTGTVVTLILQNMPVEPGMCQQAWMGLVLIGGLVTVVLAAFALVPRTHAAGMPALQSLRELAAKHEGGASIPLPVNQFSADMLRAGRLDLESPVDHIRETADVRMKWLTKAYISLGVTFTLTMILMYLDAIVP